MKLDAKLVKRLPPAAESPAFDLDLHLQADAGVVVLWGPSGAGKTLTLNCLGGFSKPDGGRILLNDDLYFDAATGVHLSPQQRRCGYIFQDNALFPHMTVRANLRFAATAGGANRGLNRRRRVKELLDAFELGALADRKPAQLSGGQKQRAALARILVNEPRLLLLDEPTRGLDARLRQAFYEVLRQTRERLQALIVIVTHDLAECFELADYVCLMQQGKFIQAGPADQVFAKPATIEIARSLGIYNILPAVVEALDPGRKTSRLAVFGASIDGPYLPGHLIGDHGHICFRQSELRVLQNEGKPGRHQLQLRVLDVKHSSSGARVRFENDVTTLLTATAAAQLRAGEQLRLEVPAEAVCFLEK